MAKLIGIGVGLGFGGSSWSSYWKAQKSLEYSSRSGFDLLETGSGSSLNAKIIPSNALIKSTDYVYKSTSNYRSSDSSGYVEIRFYFDATNTVMYLFSTTSESATARYFMVRMLNKYLYFDIRQNITTVFNNQIRTTATLAAGWHTVRVISSGGHYSFIVDGTTMTVGSGLTVGTGSDDGKWLDLVTLRGNVMFGCYKDSGGLTAPAKTWNIDYVDYNNVNKWIFTGQGNNVFDIIGTLHLAWTGTSHQTFDLNGSTLLLDSGYSLWRAYGVADEYVPYKSGAANDVSAYLTTYSKISDHAGSAGTYNLAPSLVDFDYTDGGNALLALFDRSNTTRQTAASRSSVYYDASNTYRYHSSELANPITLNTLFNVGYKGMYFPAITATITGNNNYPVSITKMYLLKKDTKGSFQKQSMDFCGTNVFYASPVVYDADGYVLTLLTDIKHFGALPSNTPEANFTAIQKACDYVYNTTLTFGSAGETYRTSQPVYLSSYKTHTINSTIKIKDATIAHLTQNYTAGDGHIHVDSVAGFNVGEWIGITDNNQTYDYNLWYGMNIPITSIDTVNKIIYFTDTGCIFNYTTAHSAWFGHAQSCIIADTKTNVTITGTGTIDCNQQNQAPINGLLVSSVFEELKSTSGFAGWVTDNITISNLHFINGLRHNICISGNGDTAANRCDAPTITNVTCTFAHNKNLLLRYTDSANVSYYTGNDAIWEDGLMFYLSNTNATIDHISCARNGRFGLGYNGASTSSLVGTNITTSDNVYAGVSVTANGANLNGLTMSDRLLVSNQYDNANNTTIANVAISNYHTLTGLYSDCVVGLLGEITACAITELSITNCTMPIGILSTNQFTPTNPPKTTTINGGGFYSSYPTAKTSLYAGSDITITDFDNYP